MLSEFALAVTIVLGSNQEGRQSPKCDLTTAESGAIQNPASAAGCAQDAKPAGDKIAGKSPTLSAALQSARITSTLVRFRICVDAAGKVNRVIVIASSGNPDVDRDLGTQLCKWRFRPRVVEGRKVPSYTVVSMSIHL